jgi:hypothetical protein
MAAAGVELDAGMGETVKEVTRDTKPPGEEAASEETVPAGEEAGVGATVSVTGKAVV